MNEHPSPLARIAKTLAILLGAFLITEAIRHFLSNKATAGALVAAVATEWICGTMGVAWSDPHADPPTTKVIARRIAKGLAIAGGIATLTAIVLIAAFGAKFSRAPMAISEIVISLAVGTFIATRHELLAHGLLLRALQPVPSRTVRVIACAALSFAFVVGTGTSPREAVVAIPLGACSGLLWMFDRGAFAPVAFHSLWMFVWSSILHGSFFDLRAMRENLWTGRGSLANGGVAVIALTVVAALLWRFGGRLFARPLEKTSPSHVN